MEFCSGLDLFDSITKHRSSFSEKKAAEIMKNLFLAVNHCHSNKVCHRDLKPENIMYNEKTDEIKIIDFGLSRLVDESNGSMKTMVGTAYYIAPEVINGQYGFECDCWSLGVIMYALVSGYLPFYANSPAEVFDLIKNANVSFEQKEFESVSEAAKDLIRNLLSKEKSKRYSCT